MSESIGLNFIMGGRPYAYRQWPAVPRQGDIVKLHDPDREEGLRYPARVLLVVWGSREESWAGKLLECEVHIQWDDYVIIPKLATLPTEKEKP